MGGVVHASPTASLAHQIILDRLHLVLSRHSPVGMVCPWDVDVRLADDPLHVRVPDLVVIRSTVRGIVRPQRVLLAVEVVSPSSGTVDHIHKAQEYARAGIPGYWLIDHQDGAAVTLTVGRLNEREARYDFGERISGEVRLSEPFPIAFDVSELAR